MKDLNRSIRPSGFPFRAASARQKKKHPAKRRVLRVSWLRLPGLGERAALQGREKSKTKFLPRCRRPAHKSGTQKKLHTKPFMFRFRSQGPDHHLFGDCCL
jgi:hypothetical protein